VFSSVVLQDATGRALARSALQPIETQTILIEDDGVRFIVRAVSSLAHKGEAARAGKTTDPLGDDRDLFVMDVGSDHCLLLNKYPLAAGHALLVTRRFESQERLLGVADFAALQTCLHGIDGLGFYNGGAEAGASQRRKHLHLVPLPLEREGPDEVPVERVLAGDGRLPFSHGFARIAPDSTPSGLHALYRELLDGCRISGVATAEGEVQSAPYNLLLRRGWMLVVPRSQACFASICVNALGFAGALIVRSRDDFERVRVVGPMQLLRRVGMRPIA
jgi:ATP adenylyltransferase